MFSYMLAFSLLATAPGLLVESDPSHIADQEEIILEEMMDDLDVEEIVFEDMTLSADEEDELDLE